VARELDGKVLEVQFGIVRRFHGLSIWNADSQAVGGRHFVRAVGAAGDEVASASRV
jgi:hypothetical protein